MEDPVLGRRSFLKRSGVSLAGGLAASALGGGLACTAHADALTKAQRDAMTPEQIIAAMQRGNERFRAGQRQERNFLAEQRASATGQYPAAVILSCIDSRAPAEIILDLGIGDVFNCRVAGNVANDDILGSMEFGCQLAGARVVVVMGHTACGAIKGAIDDAKLGHLTELLAKIRPAVEATRYDGERSSKNAAFVDAVARRHVELTTAAIRERSAVLRELEVQGKVDLVGAMYDLGSAKVEFFAY